VKSSRPVGIWEMLILMFGQRLGEEVIDVKECLITWLCILLLRRFRREDGG
jgi:hypothetical protein